MQNNPTTIERAFALARSGLYANVTELVNTLRREGRAVEQITGPTLKRQLRDLIAQAKAEPVPRN